MFYQGLKPAIRQRRGRLSKGVIRPELKVLAAVEDHHGD